MQQAMIADFFRLMKTVFVAFKASSMSNMSSPSESSDGDIKSETVMKTRKVLDEKPRTNEAKELQKVPALSFSIQSVMSENKDMTVNEDAAGIVTKYTEGKITGGKMIVCDGVTNNWLSKPVAAGFVELAKQKEFWSFEELSIEDVKPIQEAWEKAFRDSHYFKKAEQSGQSMDKVIHYLETKNGATTFNQVEIDYDPALKCYMARVWILGNGAFLVLNKSVEPRIIYNGEDSLSSDGTKGFCIGRQEFFADMVAMEKNGTYRSELN